jgi:hypothetical protein
MSDALERIKNRQRPEVPKRDPGITSTTDRSVDSDLLDLGRSTHPDIQISTLSTGEAAIQSPALETSDASVIEVSTTPDIQISTLPEEISFPVKQTTLRLEKGLSNDLQALCQREQICREVLIEAMFLEMMDAPELREGIIHRARERQRKRTAVANHKRALSMVQRVSNQV